MPQEIEFQTIIFNSADEYNSYLKKSDVWSGYGSSRALGVLRSKTQAEVLIDKSYYASGGIREDQLPAIAVHEQVELASNSKNAHMEATVKEYQYILENFGPQELNQYHCKLCNLMGGDNRVRSQALALVTGKS